MTIHHEQPYLHDQVLSLAAPWVVVSAPNGQVTGGVQGVFARDRRVLSRCEVLVDGRTPVSLGVGEPSACRADFTGVLDWLGDGGHDPTVTLHRRREVTSTGLAEEITIRNRSRSTVRCTVELALATDLAGTDAVRSGAAADLPEAPVTVSDGRLSWSGAGAEVSAVLEPVPERWTADSVAGWECEIGPGAECRVELRVAAEPPPGTGFRIEPPANRVDRSDAVRLDCTDARMTRWLRRSLSDLAGLTLADPDAPDDRYLGAGPPWYLTLFGRDSLISAAMLVAVDPGLAAGTLRALARRQGTRQDVDAAEQPGKIPHELRMGVGDHGGGLVLPAAYYGSHDATPLWVTTLHRAWRWGLPDAQLAALMPTVRAALGWLRDFADPDGDGFAEYVDTSGHGLANQGWKDSVDAVQWPDGRLAAAPIALSEVQAYAYAAALAGADLLEAFDAVDATGGVPEAVWWRSWAAELKQRFRVAYWVDDEHGGYPAIALDGDKRPVAGPASNMGHLLATGILDRRDAGLVAARLASPELDSGFGLRTMSSRARRFNPLGYHTGSIWPHDTALAIEGLAVAGHSEVAASYVEGLLGSAEGFGYRLPELYGGLGRAAEPVPTPYPLACRPQAWAAAAPAGILTALLGIVPDVPRGTLRIAPMRPFPWRSFEIRGLRVGGGELSLRIDDDHLDVLEHPGDLSISVVG
ncbi:MAG TPA: glycogen debranching N-terminal domain-containing protein [Jiangellaceae bacterium]